MHAVLFSADAFEPWHYSHCGGAGRRINQCHYLCFAKCVLYSSNAAITHTFSPCETFLTGAATCMAAVSPPPPRARKLYTVSYITAVGVAWQAFLFIWLAQTFHWADEICDEAILLDSGLKRIATRRCLFPPPYFECHTSGSQSMSLPLRAAPGCTPSRPG